MKKSLLSLSISIWFISLFVFAYSSSDDDSFVGCLKEKGLSDILYNNGTEAFANILMARIKNLRFERTSTKKPIYILAPMQEAQVSTIVTCAKYHKIQLKIRSGGHDYEGTSYVSKHKFVILDMFNLNSIHVDVEKETACVGAGALLGELYYQIWNSRNHLATKSLAFPAGVCPTVAVGGHFSGGGYGNMLRRYGLSIDNMISAKIAIANGSILSISEGNDLFWAIRGGGGASFGVILSYTIQLVTIEGNVTVFRVERFENQNASGILYDYQNSVLKWNKNLFIRVLLQPFTSEGSKDKTLRTTYMGMYTGNTTSLIEEVSHKFPSLGLNATDCKEMSWIYSVLYWANFKNTTPAALRNASSDDVGFLKRKSDYVKSPISIPHLEAIFRIMAPGKVGMVFNSYGGKMDDIHKSATAFPHRKGNILKIQYSVNWKNTSIQAETEYMKQIRNLYSNMTSYVSNRPRESFLNYKDLDIGTNKGHNNVTLAEVYGKSYFKDNFGKLVVIKTAFDPDNFFQHEQSIPTR